MRKIWRSIFYILAIWCKTDELYNLMHPWMHLCFWAHLGFKYVWDYKFNWCRLINGWCTLVLMYFYMDVHLKRCTLYVSINNFSKNVIPTPLLVPILDLGHQPKRGSSKKRRGRSPNDQWMHSFCLLNGTGSLWLRTTRGKIIGITVWFSHQWGCFFVIFQTGFHFPIKNIFWGEGGGSFSVVCKHWLVIRWECLLSTKLT